MENEEHPQFLFDAALFSLESGKVEQALFTLAGALDAVAASGDDLHVWRRILLDHALSAFVTPDGEHAGRYAHIVAKIGHHCAAASRTELASGAVRSVNRGGGNFRVCDPISSRFVAEAKGVSASPAQSPDCLFAFGLLDRVHPDQLASEISRLGSEVPLGGKLLISCFVPGHAGHGWQRICEGSVIHCHGEAALESAARKAGLKLTHFRDASNCLIWAELRRPSEITKKEGNL